MAFKHGMLLDPSLFLVIISFLQALPADTTVLSYKRRYIENSVEECAFEIHSNTAICERLGLTNVPKELPEDVEILRISENSIKSLMNSSFERYPHVTYLDVSDNDIRVIEPTTFYPLNKLTFLSIAYNQNLVLPAKGLLMWATKLSSVSVEGSGLKLLPGDILRWSPTLESVNFTENELTTVNISLCGTVGAVYLSYNYIEQLTNDTFTFTCQTDELHLTGNPIRSVDPGVIESLQVQSLVLGGYTMTLDVVRNIFIGVSRSKIENLAINFAGLGISGAIRKDLFDPLRNISLSLLELSGDSFSLHSSIFSSLNKVTELVLNQDEINRIEPDFFEGMQQLRVLNLNFNQIRTINTNGSTWKSDLINMHLSHNGLKKISPSTFRGLQNLRLLDLTNNYLLVMLELTSFSELKRIETIILSYSNLLQFELVIPSLRSLSMDRFSIYALTPGSSFNHTRSLERLRITDSSVSDHNMWDSRSNVSLFEGLFSLTTLDLSRNPKLSITFKDSQPRIF